MWGILDFLEKWFVVMILIMLGWESDCSVVIFVKVFVIVVGFWLYLMFFNVSSLVVVVFLISEIVLKLFWLRVCLIIMCFFEILSIVIVWIGFLLFVILCC